MKEADVVLRDFVAWLMNESHDYYICETESGWDNFEYVAIKAEYGEPQRLLDEYEKFRQRQEDDE